MFTSRTDNVGHHRTIQAAVRNAVSKALRLATLLDGPPTPTPTAAACIPSTQPAVATSAAQAAASSGHKGSGGFAYNGPGGNGSGPLQAPGASQAAAAQPPYTVRVNALSLSCFQLPLAAAVTTGSGGATRNGLLMELRWRAANARGGRALGEISPLPGERSSANGICAACCSVHLRHAMQNGAVQARAPVPVQGQRIRQQP